MKLVLSLLLAMPFLESTDLPWGNQPGYFVPKHRISGIGVSREELSDDLLAARTAAMIESQTFGIMREQLAVQGAERVTSPRLQAIFQQAARKSGIPVSLLEAITYLESWGNPKAESPSGPRGIMQFSEGTARRAGLRVVRTTRYKVKRERVLVRRKGRRPTYRTIAHRTPYIVTVRDERLLPEKAIFAAAGYLAQMEQRFGGRDWAVFAYHCGEGCVAEMRSLAQQAKGIPQQELTVASMFFSCSPVYNRELYSGIQAQMGRDYSPTYWFRIRRAQQLLDLYRKSPGEFQALADEYKTELGSGPRAAHRLSAWLKKDDLAYQSCDDIRAAQGKKLFKALDKPKYFGYTLRNDVIGRLDPANRDYYFQASPAAIGTLTYITYETRRLFDALKPKGEKFEPIGVTSLVEPLKYVERFPRGEQGELLAHCTGQVFDIDYGQLPPGERQCLRFVLDDLGWNGYLGFVDERPGSGIMHIGCAPTARDFFTRVFEDALDDKKLD